MDKNSLIDILIADLKSDEGFVAHGYRDSLGHLTIGYGRLIDQAMGGGISQEEATYLLRRDVRRCVTEFDSLLGHVPMNPARKSALVNMLFNLGKPKFRGFKKMLAAIEDENWEKAAAEALDSKWANQTGRRAQRLAAQIESGKIG